MRPELRPKKILIVDDEAYIRLLLRDCLRQAGYDTVSASDGREALEVVREETPDLVLLDITMPEMDGWQVLKAIRADDRIRMTPVVMLTARGEAESLMESQTLRAEDYFIKPFAVDELVMYIRRYLNRTKQ